MQSETIRFRTLEEFFLFSAESDNDFDYTVAWLDCTADGKFQGRGLFTRGNHATPSCGDRYLRPRRSVTFPVDPAIPLVNPFTLKAFNACYYHRPRRRHSVVHYDQFFYPLDRIHEWNRIYGRKGFMQYQCVVPSNQGADVLTELLTEISLKGDGSFLTVLKKFGDKRSPGLLLFPRLGYTLALDFPNQGQRTLNLLEILDEIVRAADGAVYPAKDARMTGDSFRRYYPAWEEFTDYIDPLFSSRFWRRVMGDCM